MQPKMGLGYLLELATGHYKAKVLFVATNLKIFNLLSERAKTIEEIADDLNINMRPANMLLNACVSLNLLEKKDNLYLNTRTADLYLVEGRAQYMEPAFFKFDEHSYMLFDKLEEAILTDKPQVKGKGKENPELSPSCMLIGDEDDYAMFISAMDPIATWPANIISSKFGFEKFSHLLDVGGGSGIYSNAIVAKNPNLKATVMDLPHVCEIGNERINKKELSEKIKYQSGDYLTEKFPDGADVVLLSNILHGYDPKVCRQLLKKIFDYLPRNGAIIISDTVLNDDGCGPEIAVLLSFYYLLITDSGRNYTLSEYKNMLKDAGYADIDSKKSSGGTSFISGFKR